MMGKILPEVLSPHLPKKEIWHSLQRQPKLDSSTTGIATEDCGDIDDHFIEFRSHHELVI